MNSSETNAPTGTLSWPLRILSGLLFVERILFGVMFTMSGITWWSRDASPGDYLIENVALSVEKGMDPAPVYDLFFNAAVLPHPALFASMAAVGELLVGLALILAFPKRMGALGGVFLMANYGLTFGNGLIPPSGNFILMLLFIPLLSGLPYRVFTPVHRLLARRVNRTGITGDSIS